MLGFENQDKIMRSQNLKRIWSQNCKLAEALVAQGDGEHGYTALTHTERGVVFLKGAEDTALKNEGKK